MLLRINSTLKQRLWGNLLFGFPSWFVEWSILSCLRSGDQVIPYIFRAAVLEYFLSPLDPTTPCPRAQILNLTCMSKLCIFEFCPCNHLEPPCVETGNDDRVRNFLSYLLQRFGLSSVQISQGDFGVFIREWRWCVECSYFGFVEQCVHSTSVLLPTGAVSGRCPPLLDHDENINRWFFHYGTSDVNLRPSTP